MSLTIASLVQAQIQVRITNTQTTTSTTSTQITKEESLSVSKSEFLSTVQTTTGTQNFLNSWYQKSGRNLSVTDCSPFVSTIINGQEYFVTKVTDSTSSVSVIVVDFNRPGGCIKSLPVAEYEQQFLKTKTGKLSLYPAVTPPPALSPAPTPTLSLISPTTLDLSAIKPNITFKPTVAPPYSSDQ
jgi:hypothetical protein